MSIHFLLTPPRHPSPPPPLTEIGLLRPDFTPSYWGMIKPLPSLRFQVPARGIDVPFSYALLSGQTYIRQFLSGGIWSATFCRASLSFPVSFFLLPKPHSILISRSPSAFTPAYFVHDKYYTPPPVNFCDSFCSGGTFPFPPCILPFFWYGKDFSSTLIPPFVPP